MKKKAKLLNFVSPVHKAGRQISIFLGRETSHFDAAPGELHLLNYLRLYGPCKVSELVRVFGYKNTTMTSILDRLEKRDYIHRELNPNDRRSFLVRTTAKGNRLALSSLKVVEEFDNKILAKINKSDLDGFKKVMAAISEVTEIEFREKK